MDLRYVFILLPFQMAVLPSDVSVMPKTMILKVILVLPASDALSPLIQ